MYMYILSAQLALENEVQYYDYSCLGITPIDSYCRDERVIVKTRYCRLYTGLGLKDD